MPSTRWSVGLLFASLLLSPACGKDDQEGADGSTSTDGLPPGADPADPLVVRIHTSAPVGALPTMLAIQTWQPVFTSSDIGAAPPEGTVLRIEPPVEGSLVVTGLDQLSFLPAAGAWFKPDTSYTATLTDLVVAGPDDTRTTVTQPRPDLWTTSFQTPAFGFVRASLAEREVARQRVAIDVGFAGDIDPADVAGRVRFTQGGQPLTARLVGAGSRPTDARFELVGPALMEDGELGLSIDAGVPFRRDSSIVAPAASATVQLHAGPPVEILAVVPREGVNGRYIDVICRDPAAGGDRWYWDRESYEGYEVSNRCNISEDEAARAVRTSPPLELTATQSPGGFRLFGDFQRGELQLELLGGLRTVDGGVLAGTWSAPIEFAARKPSVLFEAKGRYLPRSAWRNLAVRHLNVDELRVVVRHVPAENLVFWLTGDEDATERTSNVVADRTLTVKNPPDFETTTWVDVQALMPSVQQGVYEVEVSGAGQDDSSRLVVSDLQLVAKRAAPSAIEGGRTWSWTPEIQVWALGVHDNRPVSGVELRLVRSSGKNLATCRTGMAGDCTLVVPQDEMDSSGPVAIIATQGDDLTYLRFSDVAVETEDDKSGLSYRDEQAYRAAVQLDRGVYRPGDTAHLTAVVRGPDFLAPSGTAAEAGVPVVVKVYDPQGKELRRRVETANQAGMLVSNVPFADFARTGRYRVALEIGDSEIGQASFNVEEFVPERMAVDAKGPDQGRLLSEPVPVTVDARWLFGGSAEGSRVEVDCSLEAQPAVVPGQPGYHFGLAWVDRRQPPAVGLGAVEGTLDSAGRVVLDCPASNNSTGLGSAEVVAQAMVFEGESGRSTISTARVPVHPSRNYLGLKANITRLQGPATVQIDGVLVDWLGKLQAQAGPVDVRVYRMEEEYGWWWDEESGDSEFRRQLRRAPLERSAVSMAAGRFKLTVPVSDPGAGLLVEVSQGDARTELWIEGKQSRYAYWDDWGNPVDQTPRPDRPTPLAVVVPALAKVGEKVEVSVEAPFRGRLLWTVETDHVLHSHWMDVEAGKQSWTFELDEFAPNVYATALLLKDPHLESADAFIPGRAFGLSSVRVEPTDFSAQVQLTVPSEVRPNSELLVKVQVPPDSRGPTFVTVAAVDQGILSLTKFPDPDPLAQIFARRALGVDSFETIGWTLLGGLGGPSSRTGGDSDGDGGGRVQAVKPVALWSGLVEVPASGTATIKLQVPSYRGELRVMAVAASPGRLGAASSKVAVKDPLVLLTTLPRFLVQGDVAQVPVMVTNMTGAAARVALRFEASELGGDKDNGLGPVVELVGAGEGGLQLAPGASGTVAFRVRALRVPSAARLRIVATAGKEQSFEELDLPLLSANPETTAVSKVALHSGGNDLTATMSGWIPGTDRSALWVTTNPHAASLANIGHLVRYPYGCIEQTTSTTRPLLFVKRVLEQIEPTLAAAGAVDDMVGKGIERILSMQTPSGGFAYWPGGSEPDAWGTAYATLLLLDAKDAGFAVGAVPLDDALDYIERVRGDGHSWNGGAAMNHYVLARAGRGRPAEAVAGLERVEAEWASEKDTWRTSAWRQGQLAETRTLWMAAAWLGGDRRYEARLKDLPTDPIVSWRANDYNYFSTLRGRALQLAVHTDLFGGKGGGGKADGLAEQISLALARGDSRSFTTVELGWALTALGKRMAADADKVPALTLTVGGKAVAATAGRPASFALTGVAGRNVAIDGGAGGSPLYALISTRGVRSGPDLPVGGAGMVLKREFLDSQGKPLDPSQTKLGDRVLVRLSLKNTTSGAINNVALVDRVPAGWEIENARLGRSIQPDWVDENKAWGLDYLNVRDDRLEVFGQLPVGDAVEVVYAARAVTAGTFTLPQAQAEAMYDPGVWARVAGEAVEVLGPWAGSLL
jgi:alpha-2-macroglobulin